MSEIPDDNYRRIPDCPRCGYELRGLPIPGGQSPAGPGQCPECGLAFEWAALLDPLFTAPRWFVELDYAGLISNSLLTTLQSLMPWKFWRQVQMGLPRRMGRAIVALVIGVIAVWLLFGIINIASSIVFAALASPMGGLKPPSFLQEVTDSPLKAFWKYMSPEGMGMTGSPWLPGMYVGFFCVPFAMLLLPQTLKRAKVLPSHLVRIALYGFPLMMIFAEIPPIIVSIWWMIDVGMRGGSYAMNGSYFVQHNNWWLRPGLTFMVIMLTWGFACSRYLKLTRAWFVAFVITFLSVLIGVVYTFSTNPPAWLV